MRFRRIFIKMTRTLPLAAIAAMLAARANAEGPLAASELMNMSLEELMDVPIYSASKFPQKMSDAPGAVTVLTAQDIKDYGWRTLADIVNSVRGTYINYDRNYSYAGVRGFGVPGDANTRVLILVDGTRMNDAAYDQGPLGTEFPVDVDLIERVEFLPGAGSASYGNNAFFGVVNVVTKSGKDFSGKGLELSGRFGSYNTDQERMSVGRHFDNGLDVLVSSTHYDSGGHNRLYFPELASASNPSGISRHSDFDKADRLLGKFSWNHFTLEGIFSNRNKGIATGAFATEPGDPRNQNIDRQEIFSLTYQNAVADNLDLYARAYSGRYVYSGTWIFGAAADYPALTVNKEYGEARWWGTELRLISTHFDRHKILVGGEFQDNYHLSDRLMDVAPYDPASQVGYNRANNRHGVYVQDEFTIRPDLILNAGLRHDYLSYAGNATNPRLALIYKPVDTTSLKFLYGSSFRAPTSYELYYTDPIQKTNPGLKPERIETYEAVVEYQPEHDFRLTATGFHYQIENLIRLDVDPVDGRNVNVNGRVNKAWGAEFEVQKFWDMGARLRASYAWVNAFDTGNDRHLLVNSPISVAKLNASTPLFGEWLRAGVEGQYTSRRKGRDGTSTSGYPLLNLTLTSSDRMFRGAFQGLEISGSIYNLLDEHYDSVTSDEYFQYFIPQNGRNFRLVFSYRY
jgi:iron complex outermembrane receptor protein